MAKILLIEDEPNLRESLSDILREKGFEITLAEDGRRGIELVLRETFDVIISDLRTPAMTAMNLLSRLGELSNGAAIIVISGHSSELTEQKCKEIGVVASIKKPFSGKIS